jgi:hypothetical protein
MAIHVMWDNEDQTIFRYQFEERWTWDEFFDARDQALAMIDTVSHKVGVIMDAPPNIKLPPNLLTHSLSSLRHIHPNTVILVFIAGQSFLSMMVSMMAKMSHMTAGNLVVAANLHEARAIIAKRLHSLNDIAQPTA